MQNYNKDKELQKQNIKSPLENFNQERKNTKIERTEKEIGCDGLPVKEEKEGNN